MNNNRYNDFIETCRNIDFSKKSEQKDENLKKLRKTRILIQNKGENQMKKRSIKPLAAAACAVLIIGCTSIVTNGSSILDTIRSVFLGNHAEYYVTAEPDTKPIPEELKGQIYNKDGNVLAELGEGERIYNAKGQEVGIVSEDDNTYKLKLAEELEAEGIVGGTLIFDDYKEGSRYFIENIKQPAYLPDGYSFKKVEFFADSLEMLKTGEEKYMNIYYSNGTNNLLIALRYMDDSTAYAMSASNELKEITINGYPAVVDGSNLTVLIENVEYAFYGKGKVALDEIIKVAESLN